MARLAAAAALAATVIAIAGCGGGGGSTGAPRPGTATSVSASGAGGVALKRIGDFDSPLYVTQRPGSNDLYVVERTGKVMIVRDGKTLPQPFLDFSSIVRTDVEQGLLSIAFAPDYQSSGVLYAFYTGRDSNQHIVELHRDSSDPDRIAPGQRPILTIPDFAPNHNGGLLLFGPDDNLYIGSGDGGGEGDPQRTGQNTDVLLGKILRIDPQPSGPKPYTIPAGNPFTGEPGHRAEIYAYGLRNPWRFSFDPQSGNLLIGDVGQDRFEEVDIVPTSKAAGTNFGWSAFEGNAPFNSDQSAPGYYHPSLVYPHTGGRCSITGGYVVRDPALPSLDGRYVYSDFCTGQLRSFKVEGTKAVGDKPLGLTVPATSSFGTDRAGHIYVTSFSGPVYELVPVTPR